MSLSIGGFSPYSYGTMGTTEYSRLKTDGALGEEMSAAEEKALKKAGLIECEACATRMYQDGSDENDVSFKAPGHIDPGSSAATVMGHEQEHVANAYQSANDKGGKVVSATVSLETAVCPECGRSYVAGGQTNTMIKYNTDTPYGESKKNFDAANNAIGKNINLAV